MFDYQTSKHAHFDAACRAFALSHNLEDVAAAVGMRPQILRNKLNPIQPHRLTCDELLAIAEKGVSVVASNSDLEMVHYPAWRTAATAARGSVAARHPGG